MDKSLIKVSIIFEDPFWVGIFEKIIDQKLSVCKVTFGAEPKDYELQKFIINNYYKLRFSNSTVEIEEKSSKINPKRMQRIVKKQMQNTGIGTKSQQALKLQHEENKLTKKGNQHQKKIERQEYLFELKQQKRKDKHRGR